MNTLEQSVLGKDNCATLECSILFDRKEFLKSSNFARGKTYIRFQEMKSGKGIQSDIFKKAVSGENLDQRENYCSTQKINFQNAANFSFIQFSQIMC